LAAALWVVLGQPRPLRPLAAPGTLVGVHPVTIGWLTLLMLGALAQLIPVITVRRLPSQKTALAAVPASAPSFLTWIKFRTNNRYYRYRFDGDQGGPGGAR